MAAGTPNPMFPGVAGGPAGPPPPSGPYSYPPVTPPFHRGPYIHYPQDPHAMPPNPNANPNAAAPGPNPGARLMQLLGNSGPPQLETAVSMPPLTSEFAQLQPLPAMPSAPPARMLSSTSSMVPRGRLLGTGERAVHDVDSRLPGEAQPPQLEVTPIAKYTSDPGLVLGRQIAVNRAYVVYGLKLGNIHVLNINTALSSLLRGHTQRVTDMAFFAEDVHRLASASVDGRIYVWRIDEGPDEESKPQISGKIEIAIQILGEAEAYHPRICWHSHKQEILFVGIGNCVLRIDTAKVGRQKDFTVEEPVRCHLEKLIDGVCLVGKHDDDVTDMSISQCMSTRLASGSKDGTVKIWDDRKQVPLSIFKPHDGQAVYSVAFLTAPKRPNHINLITAGPLNREVKIWASTNKDGCVLPSVSETWNNQTLELVSSLEPRVEEAFFNQVAVLPQASLILLANAKKNAIYAVHVEYGPDPASTRLDYIADFTVAMPILSLTGTHKSQPDGEQVVQVYCVQTMAIQQYGLKMSLCSPPTTDSTGFGRDPAISLVYEAPLEMVGTESSTGTSFTDPYKPPSVDQSAELDLKPSAPPLAYSEGDGSTSSWPLHTPRDFADLLKLYWKWVHNPGCPIPMKIMRATGLNPNLVEQYCHEEASFLVELDRFRNGFKRTFEDYRWHNSSHREEGAFKITRFVYYTKRDGKKEFLVNGLKLDEFSLIKGPKDKVLWKFTFNIKEEEVKAHDGEHMSVEDNTQEETCEKHNPRNESAVMLEIRELECENSELKQRVSDLEKELRATKSAAAATEQELRDELSYAKEKSDKQSKLIHELNEMVEETVHLQNTVINLINGHDLQGLLQEFSKAYMDKGWISNELQKVSEATISRTQATTSRVGKPSHTKNGPPANARVATTTMVSRMEVPSRVGRPSHMKNGPPATLKAASSEIAMSSHIKKGQPKTAGRMTVKRPLWM